MGFNGVCLTASFSESPSAAAVCSLSDVLESHVPQRFFLSAKAAAGILRRAKKRGRTLPSRLQAALESLAMHRDDEERTTSTLPSDCESQTVTTDDQVHAGMDATTSSRHSSGVEASVGVSEMTASAQPLNLREDRTKAAPKIRPSYWDDTQQTDTLDCSMLAKGQMMPEKRRFACVLTPAESDRDTIQPTASRTCAEERATKPIQGRGLESGKPDPCTPSAKQSNTPSQCTCPTVCDCQSPETEPAMVSELCPVHNLYPKSDEECPIHQGARRYDTSEAEARTITTPKADSCMSVRRLTPTECEILQGFPKGWTLPGTELLETPLPSPSFDGLENELCGTEVVSA
jgi:hypothetical protein